MQARSTPLLRLGRFSPDGELLVKPEHLQPSGSVYDRIAGPLLLEHKDALSARGVGVVGGSGSVCLAFAAAAAQEPFELIVVCPKTTPIEHRILLEQHRVTLILNDGPSGLLGAGRRAAEETQRRGAVLLYAPENRDDPARAFADTLGPELASAIQSGGIEPPATLIAPVAVCGALLFGAARALEAAGVRPTLVGTVESPPPSLEGVEIVPMSDEAAFEVRMELARSEGLLVGLPSARSLGVARQKARLDPGRPVWAIATEAGDRCFSLDREPLSRRPEAQAP